MKINVPNTLGHATRVQCDASQKDDLLTKGYVVIEDAAGEQNIVRFAQEENGEHVPEAFIETWFDVDAGCSYYAKDGNSLNVRAKNMAFLSEDEVNEITEASEVDFGDLDDQADEEDGDLDLACDTCDGSCDGSCFCDDGTELEGVVFDGEAEDGNFFLVFVEVPADDEPVYITSRSSRIDASDVHDLVQAAIDGHFGRTNLIRNRELVERLAAERTLDIDDEFFFQV